MGVLSATARGWFDDMITGADVAKNDPVVFLGRWTLADTTVLYSQMSRPPGYRKMPDAAEALPDLIVPSFTISIINSSPLGVLELPFGASDEMENADTFERWTVGTLTFGKLRVVNIDGSKDSWGDGVTYKFSDAAFDLLIGTQETALASFEVFMPARIDGEPGWTGGYGVRAELEFSLASAHINLGLRAQTDTFAGTGGDEGGDDDLGSSKPRLFGTAYGRPVEVDPANNRWLISSEAIQALSNVYLGGVNSPNDFTESLANGRFDLDGPPTGDVIFLADGEKVNAGAFTDDPGKIIKHWIETLWGGTSAGTGDYDTDYPYACGTPWDSLTNRTRASVLDWMLRPLGVGFVDQDGQSFKIQIFKEPSTQTAVFAFTDIEIVSIRKSGALPPIYRAAVGYQERPIVSDVRSAVASDLRFWSQPRSLNPAVDATVQTAYPSALDVVLPTTLKLKADAGTVAAAYLARFDAPYSIFQVTLGRRPMDAWVGDYGTIQSDTLPGLSSAKKVFVTGQRINPERGRFVMECLGAT